MSSHHVVREKQEPALLVLGLDNFADDLLGQLLEWSPTVITTPQTAEQLNAFGIKIDWIITDIFDDDLQSDVKVIPQRKEESLTLTALNYLVAQGYPAVNIVTDNVDIADYLLFAAQIDLVVLSGNKRIFSVTSGFSKWKPAAEMIEIIADTSTLRFTGLEQISTNKYKTTYDGFYNLRFDEPFLFIAEEIS